MTNGTNDRMDRFEAGLDELRQITHSNAKAIEKLSQRIDSNAKAIAANSTQLAEMRDSLSFAAGRTLRAVDELREVVEEDRVNFREHLERTDTAIAGINATLAVLQQLMRDRGGNGDPQA